jgi:hypothetical protein
MTRNLFATGDFQKGDVGRVTGHRVSKATGNEPEGTLLVVALHDVKSGTSGWFTDPDDQQ